MRKQKPLKPFDRSHMSAGWRFLEDESQSSRKRGLASTTCASTSAAWNSSKGRSSSVLNKQ
jgi:hypothetical protein